MSGTTNNFYNSEQRERNALGDIFSGNDSILDDLQLRKITSEGGYHRYDCTILSGQSIILITEVKIRNHDLGYYPSSIIEKDKYNSINNIVEQFNSLYPSIKFIGCLITVYNGGQVLFHTFENSFTETKKKADHKTMEESEKKLKNFINFDITDAEKIKFIKNLKQF